MIEEVVSVKSENNAFQPETGPEFIEMNFTDNHDLAIGSRDLKQGETVRGRMRKTLAHYLYALELSDKVWLSSVKS